MQINGYFIVQRGNLYFIASIIEISDSTYCNYPLCEVEMIQCMVLPLSILFVIGTDQMNLFLKFQKYRIITFIFTFILIGILRSIMYIKYSKCYSLLLDVCFIILNCVVIGTFFRIVKQHIIGDSGYEKEDKDPQLDFMPIALLNIECYDKYLYTI